MSVYEFCECCAVCVYLGYVMFRLGTIQNLSNSFLDPLDLPPPPLPQCSLLMTSPDLPLKDFVIMYKYATRIYANM